MKMKTKKIGYRIGDAFLNQTTGYYERELELFVVVRRNARQDILDATCAPFVQETARRVRKETGQDLFYEECSCMNRVEFHWQANPLDVEEGKGIDNEAWYGFRITSIPFNDSSLKLAQRLYKALEYNHTPDTLRAVLEDILHAVPIVYGGELSIWYAAPVV